MKLPSECVSYHLLGRKTVCLRSQGNIEMNVNVEIFQAMIALFPLVPAMFCGTGLHFLVIVRLY